MKNQRRDLILVSGVLFFMIGLLGAGLPLIYSIIIAVVIYVGIKVFVGRSQMAMTKAIPEGVCAECGSKITGGACPNCGK